MIWTKKWSRNFGSLERGSHFLHLSSSVLVKSRLQEGRSLHLAVKSIRSMERTYPTWGNGKSSTQKCRLVGDMLVFKDVFFWGGFLGLVGCFGVLWTVVGVRMDFGWTTKFELDLFSWCCWRLLIHDLKAAKNLSELFEQYWHCMILKAPKKETVGWTVLISMKDFFR